MHISLDDLARQAVSVGDRLLQEISLPIKNAFGKDVTPDYSANATCVRRVVDDLSDRKTHCNDLADIQSLKLHQLSQLCTSEKDCVQVSCFFAAVH